MTNVLVTWPTLWSDWSGSSKMQFSVKVSKIYCVIFSAVMEYSSLNSTLNCLHCLLQRTTTFPGFYCPEGTLEPDDPENTPKCPAGFYSLKWVVTHIDILVNILVYYQPHFLKLTSNYMFTFPIFSTFRCLKSSEDGTNFRELLSPKIKSTPVTLRQFVKYPKIIFLKNEISEFLIPLIIFSYGDLGEFGSTFRDIFGARCFFSSPPQ